MDRWIKQAIQFQPLDDPTVGSNSRARAAQQLPGRRATGWAIPWRIQQLPGRRATGQAIPCQPIGDAGDPDTEHLNRLCRCSPQKIFRAVPVRYLPNVRIYLKYSCVKWASYDGQPP